MNRIILTSAILAVLAIASFSMLSVNAEELGGMGSSSAVIPLTTNGYVKVTFHFFVNCTSTPDVSTKIFDNEQYAPIAKGISNENGNLRLYVLPNLDKPLPLTFFAQTENKTHSILGNFIDPSLPYNVTITVYWGKLCS